LSLQEDFIRDLGVDSMNKDDDATLIIQTSQSKACHNNYLGADLFREASRSFNKALDEKE
jgi:hypothetical protein